MVLLRVLLYKLQFTERRTLYKLLQSKKQIIRLNLLLNRN